MEFLYLLESIRTEFLDTIMLIITAFGEETVFMLIAMFVLWCVDKYEGYYILFIGFIGTQINQLLKVSFRIDRPWVRDPNFKAVEGAIEEATGYSASQIYRRHRAAMITIERLIASGALMRRK